MSPRARPTLEDVARRSGVSTATVSRCLNLPDRVSKSTRDKVDAAVRELGYSPNFGARIMAARRTHTIGAVIPTMENAIFARGLQAFQEELAENGYTMLVASTSYSQQNEEEQIRALVARGAEGLLLIGHDRRASVLEFLATQKVPTLVAWTYDPEAALPSIGFDNFSAMRALMVEVLRRGHRKVAVLSGFTAENDRARLRLEGILDAIGDAGLDPTAVPLIRSDYSIDAGKDGLATLLDRDPELTAVVCGNDVLAVGAMIGARARGLRVPQDISITGFDDIELASVVDPALTTVHVPHREMGRRAAQILAAMLHDEQVPTHVKLTADLRLRDSLARPPRPLRRLTGGA